MQIKELQETIAVADRHTILKKLKNLGFCDCAKDKKYRNLPLPAIFEGNEQSTDWIVNPENGKEFKAYIFTCVAGAERTTFIVLETNSFNKKKNLSSPFAMDILFKE